MGTMALLLLSIMFGCVLALTSCFIWASKHTHTFMQRRVLLSKHSSDELVCPFVFGCRMLTSSSFIILNALHGVYHGVHECALLIFVCWFNSINYWRWPTEGIRRYADVLCS